MNNKFYPLTIKLYIGWKVICSPIKSSTFGRVSSGLAWKCTVAPASTREASGHATPLQGCKQMFNLFNHQTKEQYKV